MKFFLPRVLRPLPFLLLAASAGLPDLRAQRTIDYADLDVDSTNYDTSAPHDPTTLHSLDAGSAIQSGNLTGAGAIIKTGAGSITLAGENDYAGGTTLEAGTLRLTDSSTLGDMAGTVTINGGTLGNSETNVVAMIDNDVVVNADFAIDALDDEEGALGAVEIFGNVDLGSAPLRTITLTSTGLACFGGTISGQDLALVTTAPSSQAMVCSDTSNAFTGTLRVGSNVTLELAKVSDSVAVSGNLQVDSGAVVQVWGFNQFAATSNVAVNGTIELTSSGTNAINALSGAGVVKAVLSDTLEVNSGTFAGSFVEDDASLALVKKGPGTLELTGISAIAGEVAVEGGTLDVSGALDAGAGIKVRSGGTLRGSGSTGKVTVSDGGTITAGSDGAPGTLSTKTQTWEAGGTYEWKLDDATGPQGDATDWLDIDGDLVFDTSTGNPFTIKVTSLTLSGLPGPAANFNPATNRSWILATTTSALTGFDPDHFRIDTSGFANEPGTDRFVLSVDNHDLILTYVAVPEPWQAGFLAGAGLLVLMIRRAWQRRPLA